MAEPMDCDQKTEMKRKSSKTLSPETVKKSAESKKAQGNDFYQQQKYDQALPFYNEAISLCPENAPYYRNRAACLMMTGRFKEALPDIQKAVQLEPCFHKAYSRQAKCHVALGNYLAAAQSLVILQGLDPSFPNLQEEMNAVETLTRHIKAGEKAYSLKDYRTVVFNMDRALKSAIACTRLRILKAECLAYLGRYEEANNLACAVLRTETNDVDALYVRGMCLYYEDNIEKAFVHFQMVLKLAPDHNKTLEIYKKAKKLKTKKEEGNEAFKNGNYKLAHEIYTAALAIDENNVFTNAKLYNNRATVSAKLNMLDNAIQDCSSAIKLDGSYIKAYLRRAKCYMEKEMFEEAIRDYETVFKKEHNIENKRLLDDAKLQLKKSKRKDYYKILGIPKSASDDEIKKAYKKQALKFHPDRHSGASEAEKAETEKKFKDIGEAYTILSDAKKRSRYDSGADLAMHDPVDPNDLFQNLFGGHPGGAGYSFNMGGGPGAYQFPNGFSFQFG